MYYMKDIPQETLDLADKQFVEIFGQQVRRIRSEFFAVCNPYGIACPFSGAEVNCMNGCDNSTFWVTEETFPKLLTARLAAS
jgi:hypothetical protein